MKPRVYLETTIPSYLTAWLSRDLVMAGHQQTTREWWDTRRDDFDLFVSQFVIEEAGAGDPDAAKRRLEVLVNLPLLDLSENVYPLADELMKRVPLPPNAAADTLHIAIAAIHGMEYLLTWNCTHIANAALRPRIEAVCRDNGYEPPVICTPEELLRE
ncbi:MAG TPA: type II toxin-antitoxin system VapC family toxin [Gemmataceae bacterium]|nr:type II toxin-antitoxin system VapC family toxin [Gemmataceae bacterium]